MIKKKINLYSITDADFSKRYVIAAPLNVFEPRHDKTNKITVRQAKTQIRLGGSSEDSDQPGHPPSLIWVFAVRSVGS